ncbi:MAG TPA: hypothetical protein PLV41_01015 [Miltoncostaeales bacterium]|jgi:hypothetical protein|nr:hypothetical protein [Miltoncostaeales bacterium]
MAFVVCRADGRFEIRESVHTAHGPRARTLATFRTLDDGVLDHAEGRALRPFDREVVIARAAARGAEYVAPDALALAGRLMRAIAVGGQVPPVIAQALRHQLGPDASPLPDSIPPLFDWMGRSSSDRGDALRDLLRMTDRLPPPRRRRQRRFPRIQSAHR